MKNQTYKHYVNHVINKKQKLKKAERESGYLTNRESTMSSFNSVVKNIFDSSLAHSYAFIETLENDDYLFSKLIEDKKIFNIDVNKCRKNILYYQNYSYPVFTVTDQPQTYNNQKEPGLYYIETENYLPMRGNGWYYYPMVDYCLSNNIIQSSDIKQVVLSSLSVDGSYYNGFIDYIYKNIDEAKLAINSMIGNFKPKLTRELWSSKCIIENKNEAFNYYLNTKDAFIDIRKISGKEYFQIYEKSKITNEETEAPIYNQVLQLEAIEMHKLKTIIESKGGTVLDINTDCVSCVFENDIFPFELDGINLKDYYYDKQKLVAKYKLEDKTEKLKVERMAKTGRKSTYEHFNIKWDTKEDVPDNTFKPLIDHIVNNNMSVNIDGRAGTGKSVFIKQLQAELKTLGKRFISLAPTNKAARIINGKTIHKFVNASSRKSLTDKKIDYCFIDEISMVAEQFYKFFIVMKRIQPNIKFIVAGDFEQLLPVNDRINIDDYKTSPALHELCDGNRIQLSKCRRANKELFDLCDPKTIPNLKTSKFIKANRNHLYMNNIAFTNKRRIEVNKIMMNRFIDAANLKARQQKKKIVKPLELSAKNGDVHSQNVKLLRGMPIIAIMGNKKHDILNNEMFTIDKIKDDIITISRETHTEKIELTSKEFINIFYVAFCITCHKSQGQTFEKEYCIHEWTKFDSRLKYVALSRATEKENIHIA